MPTNNESYDFSIYWRKTSQPHSSIPFKSSVRSFRSVNINAKDYIYNWNFNEDKNKTIFLLEHLRTEFPKSTDLRDYTLGVVFNNATGTPKQPSWLAAGIKSLQGTITKSTNSHTVEFDLGLLLDPEPAVSKADQGVKQLTFIPYTEPDDKDPQNLQYFGKRVLSITTGPSDYKYLVPSKLTSLKNTSEIKKITDLKDFINPPSLKDFTISVGGIADLLLNKGYESEGGLADGVDQYILNVDSNVLTEYQLLSQCILVSYNGNDPRYKAVFPAYPDGKSIMLENDKPWFILGSNNGRIDSRTKMTAHGPYPGYKFWNRALELQSSYSPTGKGLDNKAITVAGVTFKDNAYNQQSAIQLNGNGGDSYDWWVATDPKNHDGIYWKRVKTAIDNCANNIIKTRLVNNSGKVGQGQSPIYMYDNQIFTWSDGSDGPETLAPYSCFEKNVQMITDDNIKVFTHNCVWDHLTLIQGNTGSAISFGSYGITNGCVSFNKLTNICIPRIAQYNPFDMINGVISNKTFFGKPLHSYKDFGIHDNHLGVQGDKFSGVYINSWVKDYDANQIRDIGVLSALNNNYNFKEQPIFGKAGWLTGNNTQYALGGNHFSYSVAKPTFVKSQGVKPLLYAFGDNSSKVYYSGDQWYAKSIPYVDNATDHCGFVINYKYKGNDYQNIINLYGNTVDKDVRSI